MFALSATTKVYLAAGATDLRKGSRGSARWLRECWRRHR